MALTSFVVPEDLFPFEENRSWIASLVGHVFRVAVVVNATLEELTALRESGCFEAVQFHGNETPELCATIGFPVWIRAVRVQGEHSLAQALQFNTPHLLLDAWSDASYGGTGRNIDWGSAARFVAAQPSRRLILAGGLDPGNVREAIRAVRPHAVDVASGVESSPGRKDIRRIRDFVRAVRESLCSDRVPMVEGAPAGGTRRDKPVALNQAMDLPLSRAGGYAAACHRLSPLLACGRT